MTDTPEPSQSDRRAADQEPVEPVNLLLVDDRPENLIALEASLKCREYNLFTANSGEEALAVLAKVDIALVLLDIQMPGMDGYETAARIKNDPHTTNVPVVMVTAIFKEDPHIRRGYEAGAVDYIGKPFDIDVLRKKVGIYTQLHRHRLRLRRDQDQQKLIDAQLSARKEELDQRSAQITTLLESIADPVFVVWKDKITESNTLALRMFGFDSYDDMAQDIHAFFHLVHPRDAVSHESLAESRHPYYEALQGQRAYAPMVIRNAKTGRDQSVRCSAHPVRFRDKIFGVVLMHIPISIAATPSSA